ncbi:MAG: putative anti-sigma regulatory factor, serine/threonine protein kinase [Phycisphaerales bacterium]|nr:putative anti-sigma regulatory factor, serine/threonine protein kinase [Phycisphaerales bacterium]
MTDRAQPTSPADDGRAAPPPAAGLAPPAPVHLRVTSEPAEIAGVRKAAEAYATAAGFDDAAVAEIGLVVNEAMANVIRHAYGNAPGRPIEFDADLTPDADPTLRLRLRDWGTGRMPGRGRGYIPGVPGGLGLVCLREMTNGVEYEPQPGGGMLLTLTKRRGRR